MIGGFSAPNHYLNHSWPSVYFDGPYDVVDYDKLLAEYILLFTDINMMEQHYIIHHVSRRVVGMK